MRSLLAKMVIASAVAAPALAAEVQAKKDGVAVYSDATNKSDVLTKLKSGDALTAGERKGMFWSVTLKDGKTGYVSIMSVKHKPDANGSLAKAIKNIVKEGREDDGSIEGRQRSAVMGVRGLAADDNAGNAGNIRPNLRAVFNMEDRMVSKKQLERHGQQVFKAISKKADTD